MVFSAFRKFQSFKVLVLGDFMLDTYTSGKVKRISPESPVPILEVKKYESRAGGAGNVVLNLIALGAEVSIAGRLGEDSKAEELKNHLTKANLDLFLTQKGYQTPVKNRLIADAQQLLRMDFEKNVPLDQELERHFIESIQKKIDQFDVIAISDYNKGFLTPKLLSSILEMAQKANIPSIVDPKGSDFSKYRGATILKPNLMEAYQAANCSLDIDLDIVAKELLTFCKTLLITRSEAGISTFENGKKRFDAPVRSKEVKDVTGAGDTVLAMICLGAASHLPIEQSAEIANIAAGLVIERVGCSQVTLAEIAERLLELDIDSKIFREEDVFVLCEILKNEPYVLLVLGKGQTISASLFQQIRTFFSQKQRIVLYLEEPEEELPHFLSSLHEVRYIFSG